MRPIIVEGPDGSGKSTLVAKLSRDLNLPIHHPGGPPINKDEFMGRLNFYSHNKDKFIFDRAPHISELIYPKAMGRLGVVGASTLHQLLGTLKPVIIYCRRKSMRDMWESIDHSKKAHKSPQHMAEVLAQFKNIVDGYDGLMPTLGCLVYDWAETPYSDLLKRIQKCAG
jgi:hypothetical protein